VGRDGRFRHSCPWFDDGDDTWLGHTNAPGEWCVAYHGTKQGFIKSIMETALRAGQYNVYGKGIYCTPNSNIPITDGYAQTATIQIGSTQKQFKYVFMCRVNCRSVCHCTERPCLQATNPQWTLHIPQAKSEYWFVNAENDNYQNIRVYGILIKEVKP
jgi:hypothetical protein